MKNLCRKKKWDGLLGNFPWRKNAALCLVPHSCWSGLDEVITRLPCLLHSSVQKKTGELSFTHQSSTNYSPARDFGTNPSKFSFKDRTGRSLLSSAEQHSIFIFTILTNRFTHCHFFLPAHGIEKRHMETSMQTLQTFQHSFKTNANQFFETSFPLPFFWL